MPNSGINTVTRRTLLRATALLLLLGFCAMEHSHLEYHRHFDLHPEHHHHGPDIDHALFHSGTFAELPADLIGPVLRRPDEIVCQTLAVPDSSSILLVDARAPPALV